MTKARTKTSSGRPRAGAGRPSPKRRVRKRPWYRRVHWAWPVAALALAGLVWAAFFAGGSPEEAAGEAPRVGGDLHSLVVDPSEPSRLFVGGHDGVAVSTNGGKHWRPVESLDGADAMGWAFQGDRILVGGHPGIFVSEDGGATFEQRNEGLPATDIHALGAGETVIYAASPQAGILRSVDGATWEVVTDQAGQSFMGTILVDPGDEQHLVAPDMQGGAVESTDGGRTWNGLGGTSGAMWVSWDPDDVRHLIVSGMGEAAETRDGGRTWQPLDVPAGASVVEITPSDPETLYAGVLDGDRAVVWVSRDGGETWVRP